MPADTKCTTTARRRGAYTGFVEKVGGLRHAEGGGCLVGAAVLRSRGACGRAGPTATPPIPADCAESLHAHDAIGSTFGTR